MPWCPRQHARYLLLRSHRHRLGLSLPREPYLKLHAPFIVSVEGHDDTLATAFCQSVKMVRLHRWLRPRVFALLGMVCYMLCAQYTCGMKNLPGDLPESLKHMQELLTSKLLQMPMKKLQTLLTSDDLSQVPNKEDLRHVLSSLHEVNQVGTELNVDLSGATIQGLQRAISGGPGVDSYLKDLQDLEDRSKKRL